MTAAGAEGPTRVLVVDDQALVRGGFTMILEAEPDLEVVGEAGRRCRGGAPVAEHAPDVVLMDVRMPRMDGIEATRRITGAGRARVLVLTTFDLDEYVYDAVLAGASGFLLKDAGRGTSRRGPHGRGRRQPRGPDRDAPAAGGVRAPATPRAATPSGWPA